jgi:hypothetical protein
MARAPKRPRDANQLAKLMVAILTGQVLREWFAGRGFLWGF